MDFDSDEEIELLLLLRLRRRFRSKSREAPVKRERKRKASEWRKTTSRVLEPVKHVEEEVNEEPRPPKRAAALDALIRVKECIQWHAEVQAELEATPVADSPEEEAVEDVVDVEHIEEEFSDEEFVVEEVLDEKYNQGKKLVLLKWFGDDTPSWEPIEHLSEGCQPLLRVFDREVDPGFDEDDELFNSQ